MGVHTPKEGIMARGFHRFAVLGLLTLLLAAAGCVPVTEPLSDPTKAEPDKQLLGKWHRNSKDNVVEIDIPAVKGNPKGLMRSVQDGRPDDMDTAYWFFTTTIGKNTYATIFIDLGDQFKYADFRKEGAFEKWNKEPNRRYFIYRFTLDGDKLTVDYGDDDEVKKLMRTEKIGNEATDPYFNTPPGWMAKYLAKNGPKTLYNGKDGEELERLKE
jgi:hypothetical protein